MGSPFLLSLRPAIQAALPGLLCVAGPWPKAINIMGGTVVYLAYNVLEYANRNDDLIS